MTIKVENVYHSTDLLISKRPRRHYRTPVAPVHWQLRSIVGVLKQDDVYFPGGQGSFQILKLNTATLETQAIRIVCFSPRCLVAKNGWVCCGGETGEFAAVRVDAANGLAAEVEADGRPPTLDTDAARLEDAVFQQLTRTSKRMVLQSKSFGGERVNCITLWFPPPELEIIEGTYRQPVAVLANNDKHVVLVTLADQEAIDDLLYPDCVNRAVISPNGRLLVAISDDPYLYIHERVQRDPDDKRRPFYLRDWVWRPCGKVHLKGQRKEDRSERRGSFAACFSNTGKYLAVGTQYGMISIFRTSAFTEAEDPLVTCFSSSAPDTAAGAVREMSFCPGPFDLLAWSEDRGAVGIADVRSNYISRQVLQLGEEAAYEHIAVRDRGASLEPDTRVNRTDAMIASNLATALDISSDTRRRTRDVLDRYQYPLTADETQVLEALQEHRRRREQRERRELQGSSTQDYLGPRALWSSRPPARSSLGTDNSRPRERSTSYPRAADVLGDIQAQRERIRETQDRQRERVRQALDTERLRMGAPTPPRRVGALARAAEAAADGSSSRESLASRLMANPISGAWDNLEALYNISFESSSTYDSLRLGGDGPGGGGGAATTTAGETNTRDRAAFLGSLIGQPNARERDWDDEVAHMRLRAYGRNGWPPKPDETAGLAWSEDGRKLFVGAEDGIYEFHVNTMARKLYPSVTLR